MTNPGWYARGPGITATTGAPSGAPTTGIDSLHINTSTGALSKWNGAAWSVIGNIAASTIDGGAP